MLGRTAVVVALPLGIAVACGGADRGGLGASSCSTSADCEEDLRCDPAGQRCVECIVPADCPAGMLCSDSTCSSPASCETSLDCVGEGDNRQICDASSQLCVQCVQVADCPQNNDCKLNRCVPFVPCANSLDCPQGQVCDTARGRCAECVGSSDCPDAQLCVGGSCRPSCDSDKDCTPLGLLCDHAQGYCSECGSAGCGGQPICSPGAFECDATYEKVVRCDDTGKSLMITTNCTTEGLWCFQGACRALKCQPTKTYCEGQTLMQCAGDGRSSSTIRTCAANELCAAGACQPR
ncbi:MAG: hypothetical protein R3B89_30535 [Polyangiaceae bacterium]